MRPLVLLALGGCGWDLPTGRGVALPELWDPHGLVADGDDLYAPLTHQGTLGRFSGLDVVPVDLGAARVRTAEPIPGGGVALFLREVWCDEPDEREARRQELIDDCPSEQRESRSFVGVIDGGALTARVEVPLHYNRLAMAPQGVFAVAYVDPDREVEVEGVVNLTEVDVIDLGAGTRAPVRVGFAADRILFTGDGARAVVLSQSAVAVVDLLESPPVVDVTYPLTLDPDQVVTPVGVDLTPDGEHALISVQGRSDLYVLDLGNPSVNLVTLSATPSAMQVDAASDQTLFVSGQAPTLEILDHDLFDLRTIPLDEPVSQILAGDGFVVLHGSRSGRDVYRYDVLTGDLVEYRLQAPETRLALSPSGSFAVAFTYPSDDGKSGMELIDLRPGRDDTAPYALEGGGVGLAFTQGEDGSEWALVLQNNVDYLWRGELATGVASTVDLIAPPLSVVAVGDRVAVAHDDPFGLLTFYDPVDDGTVVVEGFALDGLLDEPRLAEAP
jgi:hypothetical protein